MHRRIVYSVSFLLILSIAVFGQTPDWSGRWAGTATIEGIPGGMELTLSKDGDSWKSTMRLRVAGQELAPSVENLLIRGADASFSVPVDGRVAKFAGKFEGNAVSGTYEIFANEKKIGDGTFDLTRGGQMPPLRANPGQVADPNFNSKVANPAYKNNGPRVLFDEAHNNFHTATGRYKPFADLIGNDGYQIVPNKDNKVIAFTGQSLKGPEGSFAFMRLADSAEDVFGDEKPVSAAGRAQGIALNFGKGRVIVMGEAGMLTAQVTGLQQMPFGMNIPGIDNRQLVLNMMHWLTGKL
jgi:hypothetical protein